MSNDVRATRVTGTGATGIRRARIMGLSMVTSGAGRLALTDGVGGPVILDVDTQGATTYDLSIPGNGILASTSVAVSTATAVTAVTLFWA